MHLQEFTWQSIQPDKGGKSPKTYQFIIEFSMHCFTRGFSPEENIDKNLLYEHFNEKRLFDFKRYELCKDRPNIIKNIDKKTCFHTGKSNFLPLSY
ncbi:stationary phase growth adaptation protein [Legionella rubrilucens]|uniref:Stationary phase growth adaptation protein n=2 Tax=Legionella rubrilucens TaxID=458 RepID=A0A0W0XWT8_9GAMM|nr:stationary phase growth adaptation protein [Legionella rubrilucens]